MVRVVPREMAVGFEPLLRVAAAEKEFLVVTRGYGGGVLCLWSAVLGMGV